MLALSTLWAATLIFAPFIVFCVVWTAWVFYDWIKSPSWFGFGMTLWGVALTGIFILYWVEVQWRIIPLRTIKSLEELVMNTALSSPWFLILYGVASMGFASYAWKKRVNIEWIQIPAIVHGLHRLSLVFVIALGGVLTLLGFLGLFDPTYVSLARTTFFTGDRIHTALEFISLLLVWYVFVWLILRRYLILGILLGLLGGAGILSLLFIAMRIPI